MHQQRTPVDLMKSETTELNRKTGELNRNTNVNKMSYLAPAGTCTGTQAGRCAIGECTLADAAPLLAVPSDRDIRSCGRACSCHMHCHGHVRAQAAQLGRAPWGGQCGRRRWEGGRCPHSWGGSGPGPRSGPCPVAAHSGPRRTPTPEAACMAASHRKQVLRHEDGYLFMCYGP